MQNEVTFIVDESTGDAVYLVTEAAANLNLGSSPQRASHVEPVNPLLRCAFHLLRQWLGDKGRMSEFTRSWNCEWRINMKPVGGPILPTTYYDRKQAINAEVISLQQILYRGNHMNSSLSRFRLVQDDSSHWYAIPAGLWAMFAMWERSFEDGAEEYTGTDFNQYRLGSHPSQYTFTDLQEKL